MPRRLATSHALALGSDIAAMAILSAARSILRGNPHVAAGTGGGQARLGARGDQLALELSEGGEDAEGEPAFGGCSVDLRAGRPAP